jgi:hypothetical protein
MNSGVCLYRYQAATGTNNCEEQALTGHKGYTSLIGIQYFGGGTKTNLARG